MQTLSKKTMDIREVADLLKVTTKCIHDLVRRGHIPGRFKLGRLTRFRAEEIERWVALGCPRTDRLPE